MYRRFTGREGNEVADPYRLVISAVGGANEAAAPTANPGATVQRHRRCNPPRPVRSARWAGANRGQTKPARPPDMATETALPPADSEPASLKRGLVLGAFPTAQYSRPHSTTRAVMQHCGSAYYQRRGPLVLGACRTRCSLRPTPHYIRG
jgi:hypothetical protein